MLKKCFVLLVLLAIIVTVLLQHRFTFHPINKDHDGISRPITPYVFIPGFSGNETGYEKNSTERLRTKYSVSSLDGSDTEIGDRIKVMSTTTMVTAIQSGPESTVQALPKIANSSSTDTEPMTFAMDYWEQTGNAKISLFSLQCWASIIGINKVVEPFVSLKGSSTFHYNPQRNNESSITFSDLFDLENWNYFTSKNGFSQLVSMNYFLKHSVRNIVYVHIVYYNDNKRCSSLSEAKLKLRSLTAKGFNVIKVVCIKFVKTGDIMSEDLFHDLIFGQGNENPKNLSVIFNMWRGIRPTKAQARIILAGPKCLVCKGKLKSLTMSESPVSNITYSPSDPRPKAVVSDRIKRLLRQFLKEHFKEKKYIAVMLRTEFMSKIFKEPPEGNKCVKAILQDWRSLKKDHNISKTLFFTDVGHHGSGRWDNKQAKVFSKYIHDQLDLEFSLDDMNLKLEHILQSNDSVQIALLHQQLVAHASCVVVVGGGTFQAQTLNTYALLHQGEECYSVREKWCSVRYLKDVYGY